MKFGFFENIECEILFVYAFANVDLGVIICMCKFYLHIVIFVLYSLHRATHLT